MRTFFFLVLGLFASVLAAGAPTDGCLNQQYAGYYIDYRSHQKAWREADLVVEHLDEDGHVIATGKMHVTATVTLNDPSKFGKDGINPWPVTVELREAEVFFGLPEETVPSYYFTTDVSYQFERELWHERFRFKNLFLHPIDVRMGESGVLDFLHYDTSRANPPFPPEQLAIIKDAAHLVVREAEFALFGRSPIEVDGNQGLLTLPLNPERIGFYTVHVEDLQPRRYSTTLYLSPLSEPSSTNNWDAGEIVGSVSASWDPVAGLDCQLDENYEVWDGLGNWSPELPWRIPGRARIQLTLRTYPPRY